MLNGYLSMGRQSGGDWVNKRYWTNVLVFFIKQDAALAPYTRTSILSSLSHPSRRHLLEPQKGKAKVIPLQVRCGPEGG